ncbi:MAG: AAA family ATPase [Desulfobacterales bacterium]|nr:AAA family ATPase [Desulfobacterales bacterium]
MSSWNKIDPHLKLERIRVRNFRNIKRLDITIPQDKNIICLVGPNGGGKSALLSLMVNGLFSLTHESLRDNNELLSDTDRSWNTNETGSDGPGFAFQMDWNSKKGSSQYQLLVHFPESANHNFVSDLRREFDISQNSHRADGKWKTRPSSAGDPLARSVFLFRPSDRFEIPSYEEDKNLKTTPKIVSEWNGQRLYPIRSKSGLLELESLILDMFLDNQMNREYAGLALRKILRTLRVFRETDELLKIPSWPFRRVGLGPLHTLSQLSSGELDILVTVGNIILQQIYLSQKFDGKGDLKEMPSGWVFIDEADSHLHPRWQQKVLPLFSELFPGINFMITTHSPFVLRSLPKDRSLVIRLPDGEIFNDDFSSWRIDDILDVVFNIPSPWSEEIEEKLKLLQDIATEPDSHEKAFKLYSELAGRSSSLRSACDRILAIYGSPKIRDCIVKSSAETVVKEVVYEAG